MSGGRAHRARSFPQHSMIGRENGNAIEATYERCTVSPARHAIFARAQRHAAWLTPGAIRPPRRSVCNLPHAVAAISISSSAPAPAPSSELAAAACGSEHASVGPASALGRLRAGDGSCSRRRLAACIREGHYKEWSVPWPHIAHLPSLPRPTCSSSVVRCPPLFHPMSAPVTKQSGGASSSLADGRLSAP